MPEAAGIGLANWTLRQAQEEGGHWLVSERFGLSLSRSSYLNYLHRLGFAFKRPKKRPLKADEAKREFFVVEYGALWDEAERTGGKIFFADEAHFRADAELRGNWVLKGSANSWAGLASRKYEVRRRCRMVLQSRTKAIPRDSRPDSRNPANARPTLALI